MAFAVRVLFEDISLWELVNTTRDYFHYRPLLEKYGPGGKWLDSRLALAEQIKVRSPAPLAELVNRDMFCFVHKEKGWLTEKIGKHHEVVFKLLYPKGVLHDPRRIRLKIASINPLTHPPRVTLEECR